MEQHKPKISVIIPVYNVEKYLRQCLESIIEQTFRDFEVVLIDDGSKDSSGLICEEYTIKDSRFKTIHKENGGVSSARNEGIKASQGEWLYFCDSDDVVNKDGLRIFFENISKEKDIDLVVASFDIVKDNKIQQKSRIQEDVYFQPVDYAKILFTSYNREYQGYLWCKLFKAEIIKRNNLFFDTKVFYNEDRLFITEYLTKTERNVLYTPMPVYKYLIRETGAMNSFDTKLGYKKYQTDLEAFCKIKKYALIWEKKGISKVIDNKILRSFKQNKVLINKYSESPKEEIKELHRLVVSTIGLFNYYYRHIESNFKEIIRNIIPH